MEASKERFKYGFKGLNIYLVFYVEVTIKMITNILFKSAIHENKKIEKNK